MRRVTVTVDDEHMGDIGGVARVLEDHGMTVDEVLERTGHILGSISDDLDPASLGVEGVMAVEPDHDIQLPPPESDIQ